MKFYVNLIVLTTHSRTSKYVFVPYSCIGKEVYFSYLYVGEGCLYRTYHLRDFTLYFIFGTNLNGNDYWIL